MGTARQAETQLFQHALDEEAKLLDFFNAVEQLHLLDLNKIIPRVKTDARWAHVPRSNKPPSRVSVSDLIKGLPRHIMGCLLARQPGRFGPQLSALTPAHLSSTSSFEHVVKAFHLLATLSEMCVGLPSLRDDGTVGPDRKFTAQLIDAANLSLLAVAGPEAECLGMAYTGGRHYTEAMHRANLVPAALRAVALIASAQAPPQRGPQTDRYNWPAVCEALFTHPRGAVLLEAGFESARALVVAVRQALCSPAVDGERVYALAYAAGGTMELLTALCSAPLFYHRMMMLEPLGAAPLRLILACLTIHDAPLAAPPFSRIPSAAAAGTRPVLSATQPPYPTDKGQGAAELLAARGFALLLLLGEYEQPTFLDEVFSGVNTRGLAEELVGRSAAYVGQVLLRPPVEHFAPAAGEGQMAINVLRAAELLSDDSNFRVALIPGLAPTLAQLFAHCDQARFRSMWCLGREAVTLMGLNSHMLINSCSDKALVVVDAHAAASREFHGRGKGAGKIDDLTPECLRMGRHLGLERAVLLAKLVVNLHYYDETLPVALRDAFLKALFQSIAATTTTDQAKTAALGRAATNLEQLFEVAWEFGPPEALKGIELMAHVDMEQSRDLLQKVKSAALASSIAASAIQQQPQPTAAHAAAFSQHLGEIAATGCVRSPPPMLIQSRAVEVGPQGGAPRPVGL